MHYCTTCDWCTGSNGENTGADYNGQAIRHYLQTDHTVVRRSSDHRTERPRPTGTGSRL